MDSLHCKSKRYDLNIYTDKLILYYFQICIN